MHRCKFINDFLVLVNVGSVGNKLLKTTCDFGVGNWWGH